MSDNFGRQITKMGLMMSRFGVEPGMLASDLLGSAMHACLECRSGDVCRDWLAQPSTSPHSASDFCPNATLFETAGDLQPSGSPLLRSAFKPTVVSYVRAPDAAGRSCEGSLKGVGWEGRKDDPGQPAEVRCPACEAMMKPELDAYAFYEFEDKDDLYWASIPVHFPGKRPRHY